MHFLLYVEQDADMVHVGETFFPRPCPWKIWLAALRQTFSGKSTCWKYAYIPRVSLPVPNPNDWFPVEENTLVIGKQEFNLLPITFRNTLIYIFESVIYWCVDLSWGQINWNKWNRTGGKGY